MTIVVDVGCATWGADESIPYLVETFEPEVVYGFDPAAEEFSGVLDGAMVHVRPAVAWVYDGTIGFKVEGLRGHVDARQRAVFPAIDLARFVSELPEDEWIVLKIDAEGAEYHLLPHLRERDADLRLGLLLVEWHCEVCRIGGNGRHREGCRADHTAWDSRRRYVEGMIRCEIGEWER